MFRAVRAGKGVPTASGRGQQRVRLGWDKTFRQAGVLRTKVVSGGVPGEVGWERSGAGRPRTKACPQAGRFEREGQDKG